MASWLGGILLWSCTLGALAAGPQTQAGANVDLMALRKGAVAGNAYDQLNLGAAYDNGIGVERNIDQALFWYRKAAEQGVAEAQFNLAHLLVTEELSATAAAEWMRKAADQGMVDAEFLMGVIYAEGIGVVADRAEARRWLAKAITKGHEDAQQYLEEMNKSGIP